MTSVPDAFRSLAIDLARASGEFIRPLFDASREGRIAVELKADQTIVTEADRGAEARMREMIQRRFPDHGILGEEFGPEREDAEYVWVLDPIDGTISFAAGVPLFGTLIALCRHRQPVLGIINQPIVGELVVGDGARTTWNDRPVHCAPTARLEDALVLATGLRSIYTHQDGDAFVNVARRARLFRGWGDCYGYLMVATGRADVMCDPIMNPWDIAALVPIVRGAGGIISDWQGGDPVDARSIVAAATPELHAQVIGLLNL